METAVQQVVSARPRPTQARWLRLGLLIVSAVGLYQWLRPQPTALDQVHAQYLTDIVRLDSAATSLLRGLSGGEPTTVVQARFRETRLAWKRVEFLAELYNPETSRAINGAALPEVEEDDGLQNEVPPTGLQVLEAGLFPLDPARRASLVQQAGILQSTVGRLYKVSVNNPMTDALRLEVFRLQAMGITGFDTPVTFTALPEAAEALTSLNRHLSFYELADHDATLARQLDTLFTRAVAYLKQPVSFNDFDRLTFIRQYANPLSSHLLDAQRALVIPVFSENRLLSASARTLNDPDAFDPDYFTGGSEQRSTDKRVLLGTHLFHDPLLSGDGKRTCATCHQPDKAFTDGEAKSLAVAGNGRRTLRNAPTLLNAALQAAQFADSRVVFLEDQAGDVIENRDEMHGSLARSVAALKKNPTYQAGFTEAYPDGITADNLKNALASYVRSLVSLNSRVDRALRATTPKAFEPLLSAEERRGFNLFMGKAKCATCHFYPLFNGTVPPAYQKAESEVLGTPAHADNRTLDTDLGKFASTRINLHRHAFKTPSVRFAAKTAPYMHNGAYTSLEQVVDFYDRGGGTGLGFDVPNQTLPGDKFNLTLAEKKALVAFLKAI